VRPGVSEALVSQVDLLASLAALTGQKLNREEAPDSFDMLNTFLGKSQQGRDHVVEQALNNTLALVKGDWKYIEPSKGPKMNKNVNIELGNDPNPQLYNLKSDIGETKNVAQANPKLVKEMEESLKKIRDNGRSRPL
jgi:arylsulfatase A-like enzyme